MITRSAPDQVAFETPPEAQHSHGRPDTKAESMRLEGLNEIKELLASILTALQENAPASTAETTGKKRYKILTQKDKWFTQKFDPEKLEQALNAYADQGWSLRGVTTADIPGFGGNRNELIVVLER
jgi:hypothetical protein